MAPAAARTEVSAGAALDQYRAAETPEDGFALSRPSDLGHLRVAAQLHVDYGLRPLVWERVQGDRDTEVEAIVEHQLVGTLGLALGLIDRIVVFAGLPVNLLMIGDRVAQVPPADGTTLGDLALGLRVRIWGAEDDIFAIGLQATATAPTASAAHDGAAYAGERNFTGHPEVLLEVRPGPVRIGLNVGARFRQEADFGSFRSSNELTYGLGLTVRVHDLLSVLGEIYGAASLADFADRESSPLEAIAGVRLHPGMGFHVGLAGGLGLTRGAGTPAMRAVLAFGWALPEREPPAPVPEPEPAPTDRDGDGLLDAEDQCPDAAEDRDAFEDEDGCLDRDNDGDEVSDDNDRCPLEAEDRDAFEDRDGCPDADNDSDGILDAADACPIEPEDVDDFEDENGCPDLDNDQDGAPDETDQCPLAPGRVEDDGCPRMIRLQEDRIEILQRIEFETDSDRLLPSSDEILEEVRALLAANAQIRRVGVEGHTDDRGRDEHNMDLSRRRAESVVLWLTSRGIAGERLEPQGFGETRPLVPNDTRAHRQTNRRVEFTIVEPQPRAE
jgi:outer membrane protein OmpA-like peptidoglycan-associated protein